MPPPAEKQWSHNPKKHQHRGGRYDRNRQNQHEEESWDSIQQNKVSKRPGNNADQTDSYDYVFAPEDAVDFNGSPEDALSEYEDSEAELAVELNELPIKRERATLMKSIAANQVVIISGETGSGKTTQLPQFLLEDGYAAAGMIACTQPRRLAAMSVATRVASERGGVLGREVGYTVRFDDRTGPETKIKYMTDGMLLRELLKDASLTRYSAVMVDEAHERTLSTDILLALLKLIIRERPEFRLIVSSATLNLEKFSKYFFDAPTIHVPGRRFNVDIFYTKNPEANYAQAAILTIFQIHFSQESSGDILVFLPGQEEIESVAENLLEAKRKLGANMRELIIAPLYANMPPEAQMQVFKKTPEGARKVVLATNIAETSLTIEGIVYVVDPGFVKENLYNPRSGMESLTIRECSQASADQRAGRAGRLAPGKCFRLYTKWAFNNELPLETTPEILRTNLASVVLLLSSLGVPNVLQFDLLDRPPPESLVRAMELLYSLGALNSEAKLTRTGRKMIDFPMDPMVARALLASDQYGCSGQVAVIISLIGELGALFYRPKSKRTEADRAKRLLSDPRGDHFTLLNLWNRWSAASYSAQWCREHYIQYRTLERSRQALQQILRLCKSAGIEVKYAEDSAVGIQKSFIAGYFWNLSKLSRDTKSYTTLRLRQSVYIHPSSSIAENSDNADQSPKSFPKYVLYHELVETSKEYMRGCLEVEVSWVKEVVPHYYKGFVEEKKTSPN